MTTATTESKKPRYTHDCRKCVFKGSFGRYDVWVCHKDDPRQDSLIARQSSDGPDYASSMRAVFVQIVMNDMALGTKVPDWVLAILVCEYREETL